MMALELFLIILSIIKLRLLVLLDWICVMDGKFRCEVAWFLSWTMPGKPPILLTLLGWFSFNIYILTSVP